MIKLMKKKIIRTNGFKPNEENYKEEEVDSLQPFLNEAVELSDDFTLGDLFYFIEKEAGFFNLVFASQLGHFPLDVFLKEYKKPIPKKEEDEEIDYLKVSSCAELWGWGDIDIYSDFSGVNESEGISLAVEFTPLNKLKQYPLRLNETFKIFGDDQEQILEGKKYFTVYEIIGCILNEISFCGAPEQRDKFFNKILDDTEEMREVVEGDSNE